MKRVIVVLLLALFACHSAFAGQTSTGKKLAKTPSSKSALVRPVQATEPKAPFEAYAVADAADGKLLEGLNVNHRWPQASLTKLMLALVVMDQLERGELRLDARVTVSKKAEGMGGSQVFLKAGETFALNELMQAALVESANDAAYAVAEHAAGSSDEFVRWMNRKAQALGMLDTEFHCVHGLPPAQGGADNLTTCSDMIRLARAALAHPQIIEWTSIEQTTFRNGTLFINNKNKLVGRLPGVDGLKTGFTRRAGFNIVATGKNGSQRLIVVVLGSPESRIRDGFVMEKFREHLLVQPAAPADPVGRIETGG
jgi:serine-type D-Ala-D-Ala carboxypeptidase (penicillin-binding protein 5/6)